MPSVPAENPAHPSRRWQGDFFWAAWAVTAAFGSYFCMYGFRKPFTAGSYADDALWGVGFKTVLVTSQVGGYLLSKIIGIKIVAEMPPQRRAATMLTLILSAEGALVLFGLTPRPWNAACLFLNGLPLGMVFGLVLGFLEGRRLTELLTAGLCASFILADGVTKSVGTWLLGRGISEDWMPGLAGAIFLLPFGICVAMLSCIPPPTAGDVAARTERTTMRVAERRSFLRRYAPGLVPLLLMYLAVTIVRSIRADFAPEIWERLLGSPTEPATFTRSEMIVALGVLAANGAAVLIADNRRAFFASLATCGLGFALLTAGLAAQARGLVDGFSFMVLIGLGLYLPYVAVHTTIFERLLGMTRERGNIGFLMYVADSVGYLAYAAVMLVSDFLPVGNVLGLLTIAGWLTIGLSAISLLASWRYFSQVEPNARAAAAAEVIA